MLLFSLGDEIERNWPSPKKMRRLVFGYSQVNIFSFSLSQSNCNKQHPTTFQSYGSIKNSYILSLPKEQYFNITGRVGINCSKFDCLTINLTTLLEAIIQLLKSSYVGLNRIWPVDKKSDNWSTLSSSWPFFLVRHINWKTQIFTFRDGQ